MKMNDLVAISTQFDIPFDKVRALAKAGYLVADPVLAEVRANLRKRNDLPAIVLLRLCQDRSPLDALPLKQKAEAERQIAKLGSPLANAAPPDVAALVPAAAKGESLAIDYIISWIVRNLPEGVEVGHNWIAVRLLAGMLDEQSARDARRLRLAASHIRKAMSHIRKVMAEKGYVRKETVRPGKYRASFRR